MLKDDCFYGMSKPRADALKDNNSEITRMAEVVSLVVTKSRFNLNDIRLLAPNLKQKHTLSYMISLRGKSIQINHHLSFEDVAEQSNKKLRIKHKERR